MKFSPSERSVKNGYTGMQSRETTKVQGLLGNLTNSPQGLNSVPISKNTFMPYKHSYKDIRYCILIIIFINLIFSYGSKQHQTRNFLPKPISESQTTANPKSFPCFWAQGNTQYFQLTVKVAPLFQTTCAKK